MICYLSCYFMLFYYDIAYGVLLYLQFFFVSGSFDMIVVPLTDIAGKVIRVIVQLNGMSQKKLN